MKLTCFCHYYTKRKCLFLSKNESKNRERALQKPIKRSLSNYYILEKNVHDFEADRHFTLFTIKNKRP